MPKFLDKITIQTTQKTYDVSRVPCIFSFKFTGTKSGVAVTGLCCAILFLTIEQYENLNSMPSSNLMNNIQQYIPGYALCNGYARYGSSVYNCYRLYHGSSFGIYGQYQGTEEYIDFYGYSFSDAGLHQSWYN